MQALSSALIKTLAQDKDARVRASLAHNTKAKISDEIFVALAKDNDALVREALAVNGKVPSKLLTSLLQDDAITVQTALATNPNVAGETLMALADYDCNAIRRALLQRGDLPEGALTKLTAAEEVKFVLASRPQTSSSRAGRTLLKTATRACVLK
jgi:hypothetical protein